MTTSPTHIVPFPSTRPRLHPSAWQGFTGFASPNLEQAQYEAECLAGRCFPQPGDTDMLHRCREEYRIKQWLELFRRFTCRYMPTNTIATAALSAISLRSWRCGPRISRAPL
jgi:hypothetical protein